MAGEKNKHKSIRGHLPDLIYTRDFDQYSTNHIRDHGMETKDGKRVLRWMVFRKLYPITDLVGKQFWRVFWECFRCHLHLWRDGIRHCDISVSNLMYDKVHDRGVLNDFDLAQLRSRLPPSGMERTGTMPFMALDLLRGPTTWHGHVEREYRHDAESFAWVLLWICCGYQDGVEVRPRPLQDLIQHGFQATYKKKLARVRKLGPTYLTPTASYGQKYYNVAVNLLYMYDTRHGIAVKVKPQDSDSEAEESGAELGRSESKPDESADIDAELEIWRKELKRPSVHVDI